MEGPKGLKAAYTEMESRCKKIQADTISTLEEMKTDAMEANPHIHWRSHLSPTGW